MKFKALIKICCFLSILSFYQEVYAADLPDTTKLFYLSKRISLDDLARLKLRLEQEPKLTGIFFEDVEGTRGHGVEVVDGFREQIEKANLSTYARGFCLSSCAVIFLYGVKRTLLPNKIQARPSMLGLHPVRKFFTDDVNEFGQVQVRPTELSNQYIHQRSGGKFPLELLEQMYNTDDGSGFLYILSKPNSAGVHILLSRSMRGGNKAVPVSNLMPQDLGIDVAE